MHIRHVNRPGAIQPDNHRNWGFGLCYLYLRNVKSFGWNHKRVYRIYLDLELNLRIKLRKHLVREKPELLARDQLSPV
jgi:putative transposase